MSESTWNHRLVRHVNRYGREWYAVHEVHYQDGVPRMVTKEPVRITGETVEEVIGYYKMIGPALKKPVLNYEDFEGGE